MKNYWNAKNKNKALNYISAYHNESFGDSEAYERLTALLDALVPTVKTVDGLKQAITYISYCELYIYGYKFLIRSFIRLANRNILANSNESQKYPINYKALKAFKERRPRVRKYPTCRGL